MGRSKVARITPARLTPEGEFRSFNALDHAWLQAEELGLLLEGTQHASRLAVLLEHGVEAFRAEVGEPNDALDRRLLREAVHLADLGVGAIRKHLQQRELASLRRQFKEARQGGGA